jgi:PAS domain-containing protein
VKERSYRRFRFGIQDRIVLWLLLLGIIPVVATSLLGHWVLSTATTRATGNQLQAVCERLAGDVDAELHRVVRGLGNLNPVVIRGATATAPRNQDNLATARYLNRLSADWPRDSSSRTNRLLSGSLADELRRIRRLNPVLFERLLVTDARGVVLGATHPTSRPHHADDAWWRTTYNNGRGATYLSKLYHSEGNYLLNVAVPLYDSTGTNVVAVIRVLANLSDVAESIEDVEIGGTGFATLTSTYGDVLISPLPATGLASIVTTDRRRRITTSYPIWYKGRGLVANTNAVVAVAPVATTSSRSRANLGGSGWVVTVEQDVAEILGPTHQFGRIAVFLILLIAALVMVVGLFQSERIVRPLRDLRDGARLIGAGRLDHRLDLHTGDEIENVATEFNAMATRLDESYRGLETKIRVATAELARERNSLQAIVAALGEGLMVVDTDHHIVLWNHTAETMTGFEAKEVIGQRCDDILQAGSDNHPALCRDGCPACSAIDEGRPVTSPDMASWGLRRDGTKL